MAGADNERGDRAENRGCDQVPNGGVEDGVGGMIGRLTVSFYCKKALQPVRLAQKKEERRMRYLC